MRTPLDFFDKERSLGMREFPQLEENIRYGECYTQLLRRLDTEQKAEVLARWSPKWPRSWAWHWASYADNPGEMFPHFAKAEPWGDTYDELDSDNMFIQWWANRWPRYAKDCVRLLHTGGATVACWAGHYPEDLEITLPLINTPHEWWALCNALARPRVCGHVTQDERRQQSRMLLQRALQHLETFLEGAPWSREPGLVPVSAKADWLARVRDISIWLSRHGPDFGSGVEVYSPKLREWMEETYRELFITP
jgi:hypothetical protein